MDNLIGKKLDGLYEVKELIGAGGMANVYKAVMVGQNGPVPAGTVVAVKVLRAEYMHDPDLVNRFKNESKAISLLHHPNIVKVYDVSVTDRLQYIVMEYVNGMTLRQYLNERGGKLTSRETVHFISQILQALDHAHRNGVVHRDVKPQNIMLLASGQLRMMDFGIARISRAENQLLAGKAMGSVHYISPEQAKGEVTGPQSDIYSVGVMMYEMLSGRLPFDGDDAVKVALKQITDTPAPPGRDRPGNAPRPGGDHRKGHGKAARQPVRQRQRDAGGPPPLCAGPGRRLCLQVYHGGSTCKGGQTDNEPEKRQCRRARAQKAEEKALGVHPGAAGHHGGVRAGLRIPLLYDPAQRQQPLYRRESRHRPGGLCGHDPRRG